jgi:hypothetical protein
MLNNLRENSSMERSIKLLIKAAYDIPGTTAYIQIFISVLYSLQTVRQQTSPLSLAGKSVQKCVVLSVQLNVIATSE